MSVENVKLFDEKVMKDKELQEKIETAAKAYEGDKTDERAIFNAVIAPFAKEAGLEFTFEEGAEAKKAAEGEVDLAEMKAVAGGNVCREVNGGCFICGGEGPRNDQCAFVGYYYDIRYGEIRKGCIMIGAWHTMTDH